MNNLFFMFKKMLAQKTGRLNEKWDFNSQSVLLASPIAVDVDGDGNQEVLFGTKDGKVYVLDGNAQIKWVYDSKENFSDTELMFIDTESVNSINSPPNVADINGDGKKEIVFGSESGNIYALSPDGELLWKKKIGAPIRGGICIHNVVGNANPEIIFGASDSSLYVLDSQGKTLWKYQAKAEIESSPLAFSAHKKHIVFGDNSGLIYSLDFKGNLEWTLKTGGKITAQPAVGNLYGDGTQYIVIGSSDNKLYCIDEMGTIKWTFKTEGAILSKVALADINKDRMLEILFGSCDNNVYAITCSGELLWSYETDFWVVATPIVTDVDGDGNDEVIVGSYDHNLYILDSRGSYIIDYVPGISGVAQQSGHYSDVLTSEPGKMHGKKLWQYQTEGIIVGCACVDQASDGKQHPDSDRKQDIILNTESGKVKDIYHQT